MSAVVDRWVIRKKMLKFIVIFIVIWTSLYVFYVEPVHKVNNRQLLTELISFFDENVQDPYIEFSLGYKSKCNLSQDFINDTFKYLDIEQSSGHSGPVYEGLLCGYNSQKKCWVLSINKYDRKDVFIDYQPNDFGFMPPTVRLKGQSDKVLSFCGNK